MLASGWLAVATHSSLCTQIDTRSWDLLLLHTRVLGGSSALRPPSSQQQQSLTLFFFFLNQREVKGQAGNTWHLSPPGQPGSGWGGATAARPGALPAGGRLLPAASYFAYSAVVSGIYEDVLLTFSRLQAWRLLPGSGEHWPDPAEVRGSSERVCVCV